MAAPTPFIRSLRHCICVDIAGGLQRSSVVPSAAGRLRFRHRNRSPTMTQVRSSGGAQAPFATPVSKGKAKAAAQPDKKIAVPRTNQPKAVGPVAGAARHGHDTQVSFGDEAMHAL